MKLVTLLSLRSRTLWAILAMAAYCLTPYAMPVKQQLREGWKFKQARLNNWYPAQVPGVVHLDLLTNNIIEDPYFRLNERGLQWIDKEDWIYETSFDLLPEMSDKSAVRLCFMGLDTYADVYLNDQKILEADNMFRRWFVDVKDKLRSDSCNVLRIYFHSPIKVDIPKWDALPYQLEAGNDQSENGGVFDKKVSVFARKAGYHYGWDWGPRLVTSGIWRPVYLEAWEQARIEDVQVIQQSVDKKKADIRTVVEIDADAGLSDVTVSISLNNGVPIATKQVCLQSGMNRVELDFTIRNPQLWWTNGLGTPYLYDFKTEVTVAKTVVDRRTERIGIRSLRLVNEPDAEGKTFYFELNGVPIFAKGANYIPCDNFLPRVTPEIYKKTVLDAVDANMNMLRVWGGGTYEDDLFYDLCDQYGILVWQDFMFACSLYPAEGALLENIRQEAIDNVKRLRNHASIALWCGNNECNDAWFNWGWRKRYTRQNPEYAETIWKQFCDQYFVVLPEVVNEYAPGMAYRPSSPFAREDGPSDTNTGDRHYWEVWHGRKPISEYNKERSRFFSEYGFQSFPEFESVKCYAPNPEDWSITSEVMMSHQRGGAHANNLIEDYLLREYRQPKDFESFLYMNQLLQGDAIKTAIEAHRRDMPYCMGTLFWQHNDCWPVASWSSRDYYGRWKAQHYFAKKVFQDILVSPIASDERIDFFVVSDRLADTKGTLTITVVGLTGEKVNRIETSVKVKANSSRSVLTLPLADLLKGADKRDVVVSVRLQTRDGQVYDNSYFLVQQKEMNYPKADIRVEVEAADSGYVLSLTSDMFARGVFLSVDGIDSFFSDNYFDILPGQTVSVHLTTGLTIDDLKRQLKIRSLADAVI